MAFKLANRVLEDASNQPTASQAYNLSGTAVTGFRTFASQLADSDQVLYLAEQVDASGNPSGAWEVGLGTFSTGTPNTISRDTLYDSSTGAFIDWSAAGATPRLSISIDTSLLYRGWQLDRVDKQSAAGASFIEFTQLDSSYDYLLMGEIFGWTLLTYETRFQFGYGGATPTWLTTSSEYQTTYAGAWDAAWRRTASTGYASGTYISSGMFPKSTTHNFQYCVLIEGIGNTTKVGLRGMVMANFERYHTWSFFTGDYGGSTAPSAIDAFRLLRNGGGNTFEDWNLWLFKRPASVDLPLGMFVWL